MARQNITTNGSMEQGPGPGGEDPHVPLYWEREGGNPLTVERSNEANLVPSLPPGGGHALKAFTSDPVVFAYQGVVASAGDSVEISAWMYTRSDDRIAGGATAKIRLYFYDASGVKLAHHDSTVVLNSSSPADTWTYTSVGPMVAPAGTATARMMCLWLQGGDGTGSAYWDDCRLTINGGGNLLLNGDFEQAGVSGVTPFGIDGWIGFDDDQQKSEDAAYHGQSSLKLGVAEMVGGWGGLYQDLGLLVAGDRILMVARAMIPSSDPLDGNAQVAIKLEFDPVGTTPPPEENLAFDENATTNAWERVTLSTIVPDGMTRAKIVCIYNDTSESGEIYFDLARAELNSNGVNLLLNPSFEQGTGANIDYWFKFTTENVSWADKLCFVGIPPKDGSCKVMTHGAAAAGIYQEVDVTPGSTLDVSAWLYMPSDDKLIAPGQAGVKVEWSPGNVPDDVDICAPGQNNCIDTSVTKDVWHELSIVYTMPPNSVALGRFTNIIAKGTATGGFAYMDACEAVIKDRFDGGADVDDDDDADLRDFAAFQECYAATPPPNGVLWWPCYVFDHDDDVDIDAADYLAFEAGLTGP